MKLEPKALLIPEILNEILQSVYQTEAWWGDLKSAALVNRRWSEIALDWLWRQADIFDLLRLLSPLAPSDQGWTFEQSPSKSDWDRFFIYSPRVRMLYYEGTTIRSEQPISRSLVSHEVFGHLALGFHISPGHRWLLPNLKSISWEGADLSSTLQILHFITPTLDKIRLAFPKHETDTEPLARVLHALGEHTGDRFLEIRLEADAWKEYLTFPSTDDWIRRQSDLRGLFLDGVMPSDPAAVIRDLHQLRNLRMAFPYCDDDGLVRFMEAIASSNAPLEVLELDFALRAEQPEEEDRSYRTLPLAAFKPVLSLRRLEALSIVCGLPLPLSAQDVEAIGVAWPRIVDLRLSDRPGHANGTLGTPLSVLGTFSRCLPNLNALRHYFIPDTTPPQLPPGEGPLSLESEVELNVGLSPFSDPRFQVHVAKDLILAAYPNRRIHLIWESIEGNREHDIAWGCVNGMIMQAQGSLRNGEGPW